MKNNKLSPDISVSPQINVDDVTTIAEAGFKAIVCNRPDDEDTGQPKYMDIAEAAEKLGLKVIHQPVASGGMTQQDVIDFGTVVAACPKPVFAYCRTGTRCANLWAFSESARGTAPIKIIEAGESAGYNLGKLFN